MSSPKAVIGKRVRRSRSPARHAVKSTRKAPGGADASTEARRLAGEVERGLSSGRLDLLAPDAFQALMAALCRSYAAQVENGRQFAVVLPQGSVTPTDVMITASALLRSANLAVFELGMWQSWTGR